MENKCVLIIDSELPTGLIANTAAVLALTLGKKIDDIIGPEVFDGDKRPHEGITTMPLPILKSTELDIKELRDKISCDFSDLLLVDFSNAAQTTKNYEDYTQKISQYTTNDLKYLGIAIYGEKKKLNKLTGSLGLLR
ncbi:DUF2000 domain-containing protein [Salipaludibacillus agaradhaerens]|jgi:hypothetical protein|uniref:DUF2000 domain-containing protein n=1 Tax=Salipaludibacillus agaradhaerens TaxID=76935 RepID=UPI002151B988|nr:DUF2000 domain-containing protein [Salipaludibacillus agaradhaerens]MCR6104995.1 DUF2000 domain-containing protein [Salipaludibacillus agaradhaerens]MCR6109041.1 DUF2000 domain-containing protein [Bacillus sp. A301a_S52]MCR6117040.1 DUF2000 domain-containing protein [Salipaludibacillus agaradhaerens]UJW56232.1 DUF2000 domain-containing protein [Bacillus sp. A116_S68]